MTVLVFKDPLLGNISKGFLYDALLVKFNVCNIKIFFMVKHKVSDVICLYIIVRCLNTGI